MGRLFSNLLVRMMVWCCFITNGAVIAQIPLPLNETPFYWDVNNGSRAGDIQHVRNDLLSLKYFDGYGTKSELLLKIHDWKREEVAILSLDKSYGVNYYNVKLADYYAGWETDKIYTCSFTDEGRRKFEWRFKLIEPVVIEPDINIVVNPLQLECGQVTGNLVEFYGDIRGGKAPYTVNWFVMNSERTRLLYQPAEEQIAIKGKTTVIQVDSPPDYQVLLHVRDACGSEIQKMVQLTCDEKEKQVNTLFLDPLDKNILRRNR